MYKVAIEKIGLPRNESENDILNQFIKKDEYIMSMQEMKALVKVILNIDKRLSNSFEEDKKTILKIDRGGIKNDRKSESNAS